MTTKQLGPLIRAQRTNRKISQAALADAVGVSGPAITAVEKGRSSVSAETLEAIIAALRVTSGEADAMRAARLADGGRLPAMLDLSARLDRLEALTEELSALVATLVDQQQR